MGVKSIPVVLRQLFQYCIEGDPGGMLSIKSFEKDASIKTS